MKISEKQLHAMMHYMGLAMLTDCTLTIDAKNAIHKLFNEIMNQQSDELKDVE